MDWWDTKSNAPMPSMDNTVADGSASISVCTKCAMHSVPARVVNACWNGAVTRSIAGPNCWAFLRATNRQEILPQCRESHHCLSATLSHGAHGMAFSGCPRRLGSGHSRATSAVNPVATCFAAIPFQCRELRPEDFRHTPFRRSTGEGHSSAGEGGEVGSSIGGSPRCGWPRCRESTRCFEVCEGGESVACEHPDQRVRGISKKGPHTHGRVGSNIQDAEKRLEAPRLHQSMRKQNSAKCERRLPNCRGSWKVPSHRWRRDQLPSALAGEKISFPLAWKSCRSGLEDRFARSDVVGETIDGDEHHELRVRVGEASHPGPVQTRNARRLQSL